MAPDFWTLPDELEKERESVYADFQKLYNDKVERIQLNYSRELKPAVFAMNKKDEELLLKTEEFLNILLLQIDRLCRQNAALNTNLMESIDDVQRLTVGGAYKNKLESLLAKHKTLATRV